MCYSRLFGNCCYNLFHRQQSTLNQQRDQQSTDELIDRKREETNHESSPSSFPLVIKQSDQIKKPRQFIVTIKSSGGTDSKTTRESSVNCYTKLMESESPTTFSSLSNLIRDIFKTSTDELTNIENKSNNQRKSKDLMNNHHPSCVCSCQLNGLMKSSDQSDCGSDSWIKIDEEENNKSKGKRVTRIKINENKTIIYGGQTDEGEDIDQSDSQSGNNQEAELTFSKCCNTEEKFGMDSSEWRIVGKEMVDYIANYLDTIDKLRVTPNVEPGYLSPQLPSEAPLKGEKWDKILEDFNSLIMPGITHWQHPRFNAYFPAGNSYPSILADMITDAISCIGFSWAASPSCTELETIMLDWMGKAIGLPEKFLCFAENSKGGGVIEGSASECILVTLLAARYEAVKQAKKKEPNVKDTDILGKLIAYCSKEAHSSVEKAAMIGFVKLRILDTDDQFRMRPDLLDRSIAEDKAQGLIPFWAGITLGSTSCCSVDPIDSVGSICNKHGIWLHVDAAYGGNSLICPEFQYLLKGIELASSFNMNPNKWMLINFDCSLLWVTDRFKLTQALVVDPLYLQHSYSDKAIDYRHWGIPLSRRFRSLKLWFVVRNYGIEGLQKYIRNVSNRFIIN